MFLDPLGDFSCWGATILGRRGGKEGRKRGFATKFIKTQKTRHNATSDEADPMVACARSIRKES